MNEQTMPRVEKLFRCVDSREDSISSKEFMEAGWSLERFLEYVELCITLEACAITATAGGHGAHKELHQNVLNRLFTFLGSDISIEIKPKFNMMSLLTGECYKETGGLKYKTLVFSPDTFRRRFEVLLWITLNDRSIWAEPTPPISGISKEEASRKILKLQTLLMQAEASSPGELTEYTDYASYASWAGQTDRANSCVSDLEDEIETYEEYVRDFDTQNPYDAVTRPLFVHKGMIRCERGNHEVINKTAHIMNDCDRRVEININYCTSCMKHFISYDEYSRYYTIYGKLLGKLILIETDSSESSPDYAIAMESTLRLCGYSVSQQEGLATSERQTLLAKIMKLGVVSKSDIIRYLNYFIAFNGRKAGNELAVDKWESDLCFVRSHEIDSQESVKISDIRRH